MSADNYWSADQQAWVLPVLGELTASGAIDSAGDWSSLKPLLTARLHEYGVTNGAEELVKPLDDAVTAGADFKQLITECAPPAHGTNPEIPLDGGTADVAPTTDGEAFAADLPNAEELATQLVTDIGADIRALIAENPEFASVTDEELIAWINEDVRAALDELAEYGWESSS